MYVRYLLNDTSPDCQFIYSTLSTRIGCLPVFDREIGSGVTSKTQAAISAGASDIAHRVQSYNSVQSK